MENFEAYFSYFYFSLVKVNLFDGSDKLGDFSATENEFLAGTNRIHATTKAYKNSNFTVFEVVGIFCVYSWNHLNSF